MDSLEQKVPKLTGVLYVNIQDKQIGYWVLHLVLVNTIIYIHIYNTLNIIDED